MRPDVLQHALDRTVDLALAPVWRPLQPLANLAGYIGLSAVRLHLRLEGMRTSGADGSGQPLQEVVRAAATKACQTLRQAFAGNFRNSSCPEVLVVRGTRHHMASFPLGVGRRSLLVFTEPLARELKEAELRFLVGCEVGRVLLRHGASVPGWAVLRMASDVTVFPRWAAARMASAAEPRGAPAALPGRTRAPGRQLGRQLARAVDGVAELCDLYRGLRLGRWPGLTDLDLGGATGAASTAASAEAQALDTAAALCARARAPGLQWSLGTAALGGLLPRAAARTLDWSPSQERDCRRLLQVAAWGLSVWSAKLRTEVLSADRIGLLAAGGDEEAAVRAMVLAAPSAGDRAVAALLGARELVEQAALLDRLLPRRRFALEPSLPGRVAALAAWADSPGGELALALVE